jgi:hypothetical protein
MSVGEALLSHMLVVSIECVGAQVPASLGQIQSFQVGAVVLRKISAQTLENFD